VTSSLTSIGDPNSDSIGPILEPAAPEAGPKGLAPAEAGDEFAAN
jgi:hypothetical protein